jgi:hypothetical protein
MNVKLSRDVFRVEEIINADADEAKSLLRSEGNTFPQRERDRRQFFARRRGDKAVWLRVRIVNSAVFNFGTTVLAIRLSLRDAAQVSSASLRIMCSISASGTSCSNVSSAEMDCVGRDDSNAVSFAHRDRPSGRYRQSVHRDPSRHPN